MTRALVLAGMAGLLVLSPVLAAKQAEPPAPQPAADEPEKPEKQPGSAAAAAAGRGGLSLNACRTKVLNAKEKAHCCQAYPSELKCG